MGLNEFMSKTLKIQCMEFNSVNGMHVEDIKDIKIHVFLSFAAICTVARGHEMVTQGWVAFEKGMYGGGCGGTPSTSSVREDPHHTHPNCNLN